MGDEKEALTVRGGALPRVSAAVCLGMRIALGVVPPEYHPPFTIRELFVGSSGRDPPTPLYHHTQYFHLGSEDGPQGASKESTLPTEACSPASEIRLLIVEDCFLCRTETCCCQGRSALKRGMWIHLMPFKMERIPASLSTLALQGCAPYWPGLSLESPARSCQHFSLSRKICSPTPPPVLPKAC